MNKVDTYQVGQELFRDVVQLIDDTRKSVAYAVNSALTYMYWKIGKRISDTTIELVAQEVPQGRHFINRRFQPTDRDAARHVSTKSRTDI